MDERAGFEDEDMYSERAAKGYVSRYVSLFLPPELSQSSQLNRKSVKRALRALQSPAYAAASSKKNSLLPPVTPEQPVQEIFKLLPLSLLALRVSKADPHEGHDHGPSTSKKAQKRVKGLWNVKIEPQQDIDEDLHYIWLYEGPQWKQKLYAAGALAAIMAVVMFPLWPIKLRLGVWYLSMGVLGLIGLFTLMSIFRLILFCITYFAVPPGLWLYPNLFEDVGFFDSFRPLWGWQEVGSLPIFLLPNISPTFFSLAPRQTVNLYLITRVKKNRGRKRRRNRKMHRTCRRNSQSPLKKQLLLLLQPKPLMLPLLLLPPPRPASIPTPAEDLHQGLKK